MLQLRHSARTAYLPPILVLVLAVAGGIALVASMNKYGIGLTSDAVGYIQVARELAAGRGVPAAFTLQPPLYPLVLALAGLGSFSDPLRVAAVLNGLLFGGIVLVSGIVLLEQLPDFPWLAVPGTLGIVAGRALLNTALFAYSEPLFILLELVALWALSRYAVRADRRWYVAAILAAALACLTRYLGVALIGAGFLFLLYLPRDPLSRRALRAVMFAALASVPLALWGLRNLLVSGEAFGERAASRYSLVENLQYTLGTFNDWLVPTGMSWLLWLGLAMIVAAAIGAILSPALRRSAKTPPLLPFVLFCAVFLVLLIITSTTTAYNRISTRLLSPLFVPAWLVLVVALNRALDWARTRFPARWVNGAALGLIGLLLIFPLVTGTERLADAFQSGAGGYASDEWHASPTLAYVAAHRAEWNGRVVTNAPDALYILSGTDAASIPPKFKYNSPERAIDPAQLRGEYPPASMVLVWLKAVKRDDFLFSLADLRGLTRLTTVAEFPDGAIYRMDRRTP